MSFGFTPNCALYAILVATDSLLDASPIGDVERDVDDDRADPVKVHRRFIEGCAEDPPRALAQSRPSS